MPDSPQGWLIAVPCWGRWYRKTFLGTALPSIRRALKALHDEFGPIPVRFAIQTDRPGRIAHALRDYEVIFTPPPMASSDNPYLVFANAHRIALDSAQPNERVALLCADIIVSRECFAASERRFREGKRAVVGCATPTLPGILTRRPSDISSADLLDWAMAHAHPMTHACHFGTGHAGLPWAVYFREGENVVLRGFHLHPFAVVKDRRLDFSGTIDIDLLNEYATDEIHVVTDRHEMSMAAVTTRKKGVPLTSFPLDEAQMLAWAIRAAWPRHWWLAGHRISIQGDPAKVTRDRDILDNILRLSPYPTERAA